jgi:hypothetical protein
MMDPEVELILTEVRQASAEEAQFYLRGAAHDGTFNRFHNTLRVSQADVRWLEVLKEVLLRLGKRSWIYREGTRSVWTLETTYRSEPAQPNSSVEKMAFTRGYFDSEGGIPHDPKDRFYIQIVQKDRADLEAVRTILLGREIGCGRVHNPSPEVDSDYWRFYVLARSWDDFIREVGSWHPRKRWLFEERRRKQCGGGEESGYQGDR